jgi:molybdopterin/thiamine biosynthesis adenylyltransferase
MLELNDEDRAVYEWQLSIADFGEEGQRRLKNATVLISRAGGVGGLVAYQLAAAGVGRLVVAHAGNVRPSDLNRQLLMTHDWLGKPRIESIQRRLRELNPRLDVLGVAENISEENAAGLVRQVDLVVDCAPLFAERFAMNRQCVLQGKPLVECAMYELEAQCTTILPGETPCLQCLYPQAPPSWTRQFPVFGAVSGTVACIAAMETIKVIAGFGQPLASRMLRFDLRTMDFQILAIRRRPSCNVCGKVD